MAERDDRNQPATMAQRQRARAQGDLPVSRELAGTLTMLAAVAMLASCGPAAFEQFQTAGTSCWSSVSLHRDAWLPPGIVAPQSPRDWLQWIAPWAGIFASVFLLAVAIHWGQGGYGVYPCRLAVDFGKLNPFAPRGCPTFRERVVREAMNVLRIVLLVGLLASCLWYGRGEFDAIFAAPRAQWPRLAADALLKGLLGVACALCALTLLDGLWARWCHERRLRMSDDAVREDLRAEAVNPYIVDRQRSGFANAPQSNRNKQGPQDAPR
jgi:flagellar biosynthesis protein FlhB